MTFYHTSKMSCMVELVMHGRAYLAVHTVQPGRDSTLKILTLEELNDILPHLRYSTAYILKTIRAIRNE